MCLILGSHFSYHHSILINSIVKHTLTLIFNSSVGNFEKLFGPIDLVTFKQMLDMHRSILENSNNGKNNTNFGTKDVWHHWRLFLLFVCCVVANVHAFAAITYAASVNVIHKMKLSSIISYSLLFNFFDNNLIKNIEIQ